MKKTKAEMETELIHARQRYTNLTKELDEYKNHHSHSNSEYNFVNLELQKLKAEYEATDRFISIIEAMSGADTVKTVCTGCGAKNSLNDNKQCMKCNYYN